MPASPSPGPASRPKNTLFCPDCGHESPSDGDWRVRRSADGDAYRCPDCRTTVTIRPSPRDRSVPLSEFALTPITLTVDWLARLWAPGHQRGRWGTPDR